MEIILIANEKGGTAKTTTCLALANCLTALGFKTLVADTDPSGNLSAAALPDFPKHVLYDVFRGKCSVQDAIVTTEIADVLPTLKDLGDTREQSGTGRFVLRERKTLTSIFSDMESEKDGENLLSYLLRFSELEKTYDFVIMDSAPSDSVLITNAIVAADSIIVPCEPASASANGLYMFIRSVQNAINFRQKLAPQLPEGTYDPNLNLDGLVLTRYSDDWKTRREQIENILEMAKNLDMNVYSTKFRNSSAFEESMNECRPILDYVNRGFGASDAMNFTLEFLAKRGLAPRVSFPGVFKDEKGNFIFRKNGSKCFTYVVENDVAYVEKQNFRLEYLKNKNWAEQIGKTIFFSMENLNEYLNQAGIPWLFESVPIPEEQEEP